MSEAKINRMTFKEGSRGDKSVVWTVSDTYVNWCQILVGNPEYLERLYSGGKKLTSTSIRNNRNPSLEATMKTIPANNSPIGKKRSCPCNTNQTPAPTDAAVMPSTKGGCTLEELNQWKRLIDLVELKHKCSELQRRLQTETFYKCRTAMTKDCKKKVFECPCVPQNKDAYADVKKTKGKDDSKSKKGKDKKPKKDAKESDKSKKKNDSDTCVEYRLSEDKKGNTEGNMANKIFTFQTDPFCFEGTYFRQRNCGEKYFYPSGELAAKLECDGTGMMYYPNGELAIIVSRGKLGCRLQVMSVSGHDEKGEFYKTVPIGLFDSKGNGVVYDLHGKIRLNYDQAEGIWYDTPSGAPSRWQWQRYSFVKKRREQLQSVKENESDDEPDDTLDEKKTDSKKKISKKGKTKDGQTKIKTRSKGGSNKTASSPQTQTGRSNLAFETKRQKKLVEDWATLIEDPQTAVAIEPRPVALKLNKYLSLRILKQEHIHLDFTPYPLHFHINLGIHLKPEIIERIDKINGSQAQMSAVPCYFELLHTRTRSLRNLHSNLENIRKDNVNEDRINFIKKAKLMGVLKIITQMAMKKLNQDEQQLTKILYKCQK